MQETVGTNILDYFYDANGNPLAVKYRTSANATGTYYYYARNSRGDVIGLYNAAGSLYRTYTYDVWGNILSVKDANGSDVTSQTDIAHLQSLRYRGYYYDSETGFYYLQSRYYDPGTHRFVNEDGLISTGTGVLSYNMFAYCNNSTVMYIDDRGNRPVASTSLRNETAEERHISCSHMKESIAFSQSLPVEGEPNSSQELENPDGTPKQKRWYGPDGKPLRDRDFNHTGDMEFPHDHEWKDGIRGKEHLKPSPEFQINWEPILGFGLVIGGALGVAFIVADDISVVGVIDDICIVPLCAAMGEGIVKLSSC